jgi:hypothetical protein
MYKSERFKTAYTYKPEETRAEQLRYNHYHDSRGRFASAGANGGVGLYYSMGKGKGAVVGAHSEINNLLRTTKTGQLSFF